MSRRRHPPRREIPLEVVCHAAFEKEARQQFSRYVGCVAALVFTPAIWVIDLLLLTQYWNWFAVPLGAPAATIWHTAGIMALRGAYGFAVHGYTEAWKWFTKPKDDTESGPSCRVGNPDFDRLRLNLIIACVVRLLGFLIALFLHSRLTG